MFTRRSLSCRRIFVIAAIEVANPVSFLGWLFIIVSHKKRDFSGMDRVIELKEGKIVRLKEGHQS